LHINNRVKNFTQTSEQTGINLKWNSERERERGVRERERCEGERDLRERDINTS